MPVQGGAGCGDNRSDHSTAFFSRESSDVGFVDDSVELSDDGFEFRVVAASRFLVGYSFWQGAARAAGFLAGLIAVVALRRS